MYGCKWNMGLTREDIRDLLYVADKYEIVTLTEECAKYAYRYLVTPRNVLFLMNLSTFHNSVNGKNHLMPHLIRVIVN